MNKEWLMREEIPGVAEKNLSSFSPLVRKILYYRGITDEQAARAYVNPDYERDLHDPFLMKDMGKAVERILIALEREEKIVIYGDYDADGVPGTAVLALFFKKINYPHFDVYIPDRHNEDYGLNVGAINKFAEAGVKLIITVDCGISDGPEIDLAGELGIDVIVTDHHLSQATVPKAYAVIDNKQADDTYPYKWLCGCGVAFKLVQAIIRGANTGTFFQVLGNNPQTIQKRSSASPLESPDTEKNFIDPAESCSVASTIGGLVPGWEKWLLDLVAISTVSDMVPMTGENRVLTYFGLKVLRRTPRVGLNVLNNALKILTPYTTEDDIGFMIGPRINSASRMSHASQAYYLLTAEDEVQAAVIVDHLQEKNQERKDSVEVILNFVDGVLRNQPVPAVIVFGDPLWKLGVLGLAATRVAEKYDAPVFLWGENNNGVIKGSCRSNGTINVVELMAAAGGNDYFINYGGHALSGGFSTEKWKEGELQEKLIQAYEGITKTNKDNSYQVDSYLSFDEVTNKLYNELAQLGPFGIDNPKPLFFFQAAEIAGVKVFGNGGIHLELCFKKTGGQVIKAIGFFAYPDAVSREAVDVARDHRFGEVALETGGRIDLLANIELSYFRGRPELRLRIVDVKQSQ